MKPTLEQLFCGDICPQRDAKQTAPGCPTTYDEMKRNQEQFAEILKERAPELEKKFNRIADDACLGYLSDMEEMFQYGFGLAVKLLAEALAC